MDMNVKVDKINNYRVSTEPRVGIISRQASPFQKGNDFMNFPT